MCETPRRLDFGRDPLKVDFLPVTSACLFLYVSRLYYFFRPPWHRSSCIRRAHSYGPLRHRRFLLDDSVALVNTVPSLLCDGERRFVSRRRWCVVVRLVHSIRYRCCLPLRLPFCSLLVIIPHYFFAYFRLASHSDGSSDISKNVVVFL